MSRFSMPYTLRHFFTSLRVFLCSGDDLGEEDRLFARDTPFLPKRIVGDIWKEKVFLSEHLKPRKKKTAYYNGTFFPFHSLPLMTSTHSGSLNWKVRFGLSIKSPRSEETPGTCELRDGEFQDCDRCALTLDDMVAGKDDPWWVKLKPLCAALCCRCDDAPWWWWLGMFCGRDSGPIYNNKVRTLICSAHLQAYLILDWNATINKAMIHVSHRKCVKGDVVLHAIQETHGPKCLQLMRFAAGWKRVYWRFVPFSGSRGLGEVELCVCLWSGVVVRETRCTYQQTSPSPCPQTPRPPCNRTPPRGPTGLRSHQSYPQIWPCKRHAPRSNETFCSCSSCSHCSPVEFACDSFFHCVTRFRWRRIFLRKFPWQRKALRAIVSNNWTIGSRK